MIGKNLLWILPFLFFLAGYFIMSSLFHTPTIEIPSVVGKQLDEAFTLLSAQQLTLQLFDQKEDPDLADNTVLSQIPAPGQRAKHRQTVFLTLSKKPALSMTPSFIGKQRNEIERDAQHLKLRLKIYPLASVYPCNSCIAQIPAAGEPIPDNSIIVYISHGMPNEIIWPNFKDKPLHLVIDFLTHYGITPQLIETLTTHPHENTIVIDQRPLAGSIISLDEKHLPIVQLFTR
jgi:beta-lactam-binding protein with PASTA domain